MANLAFSKSLRLLSSGDFKAVFDDPPFRASHKHFLILARPNALDNPRLGLVIAKKNIRLAVQRNRMKRQIRETFRQLQHDLGNIDIVVLARRDMDKLENPALINQLHQQWQRIIKKASKDKASKAQATDNTPCAS